MPEFVMEEEMTGPAMMGAGLGEHLEKSIANGVDILSGCGSGTTIIFLLFIVSIVLNILQVRNTTKIVLTVMKAAMERNDNDDNNEQN